MGKSTHDIFEVFNKFAGLEVKVIEGEKNYDDFKVPAYTLDETDQTVVEMRAVAKAQNVELNVWLPRSAAVGCTEGDRVNLQVEKEGDGKWRVQKGMRMG